MDEIGILLKLVLKEHMTVYKKKIFCYGCSIFLNDWKDALSHTKSSKHLFQNSIISANSKIDHFTTEECEVFINNGLIIKNAKEAICTVCSCEISPLHNVDEHTMGKRHRTALKVSKFIFKNDHLNSEDDKIHNLISNLQKYDKIFKENGIEITLSSDLVCIFCMCTLTSQHDALQHIEGKTHSKVISMQCQINLQHSNNNNNNINSKTRMVLGINDSQQKIKQYLTANGIARAELKSFVCNICSCSMSSHVNVLQHIYGKPHLKALKRSQEETSKCLAMKSKPNCSINIKDAQDDCSEVEVNKEGVTELNMKTIIIGDHFTIICTTCFCTLPSMKHVTQHCEGLHHINTMKRRNDEDAKSFHASDHNHIIVNESLSMFCRLCDCVLPSINHTAQHISGKSHTNKLKSEKEHQSTNNITELHHILPNSQNTISNKGESINDENYCRNTLFQNYISADKAQLLQQTSGVQTTGITVKCSCCGTLTLPITSLRDHFCGKKHAENCTKLLKCIEQHNLKKYNYSSSIYLEDETFPLCSIRFSKTGRINDVEVVILCIRVHWENNNETSDDKQCIKVFYKCNICCTELSTLEVLSEHCSDKKHRSFFKEVVYPSMKQNMGNRFITELFSGLSLGKRLMQYKENERKADTSDIPAAIYRNVTHRSHLLPFRIQYDFHTVRNSSYMISSTKYFEMEELIYDNAVHRNTRILLENNKMICLICFSHIPNDMQELGNHISLCNNACEYRLKQNIYLEQCIAPLAYTYFCKVCKINIEPSPRSSLCDKCKTHTERSVHSYFCHICKEDIKATDINKHISSVEHENNLKAVEKISDELISEIKTLYWYSTDRFGCASCGIILYGKHKFVEHLSSKCVQYSVKCQRFEVCMSCNMLWTRHELSHKVHRHSKFHLYLEKNQLFCAEALPKCAVQLLEDPKKSVLELYEISDSKVLSPIIQNTLKSSLESFLSLRCIEAQVTLYGSRINGLTYRDKDVNLFIDISSDTEITETEVMEQFHGGDLISKVDDPSQSGNKIYHKEIQCVCTVTFSNTGDIEKWKYFQYFSNKFPPFRPLILFVVKWLLCCSLPGRYKITEEAIMWLVVFYLQVKNLLPSLHSLPSTGIEASVLESTSATLKSVIRKARWLLPDFFKFYAYFDYRCYGISPYLGCKFIKKHCERIDKIVKELKGGSMYSEYHPVYFPMCIQDPVILTKNLTENVESITLKHFKEYCKQTAELLSKLEKMKRRN